MELLPIRSTYRTQGLLAHQQLVDDANRFAAAAKAPSTLRAYRSDWRHFARWCDDRRVEPLPATPETVALYLSDLAAGGYKVSTISRRLSAISQAHQAAGAETPSRSARVRATMSGIRRTLGVVQLGKAPAMVRDLRRMVDTLDDRNGGLRSRALLLIGFAGAFRRSELVALDVADVQVTDDGLVVTVRRSKTDQEGAGRKIGIPYGSAPATCPVRAYTRWMAASGITAGAIFRPVDRGGTIGPRRLSDKTVALIVKRTAGAAGLDPTRYAGHSLRAGLATSAAAAGVSERAICDQTGHKSLTMLRRYIREGSLFTENAAAAVGL